MKLFNPNTPLSNFIYAILNEKNKQIKENILLGDINFNKIIFYSKDNEVNSLKTPSHISFLKNLDRQKQLLEISEEKSNLEKKVTMADNQLLSIKNYNLNQNKLKYNERYLNTNLNKINSNINSLQENSKSKNKNKKIKSSSSEKMGEIFNSLPSLGKEKKKNKKTQNIDLKPIQIKSYKSNSKVNNHEVEERLEKNAKAFIQKINRNKRNVLAMISKKQEKFALRLKNEIEKKERQNKLKLDEYSHNNNINIYNNMNFYNINNLNNNNYNNYSKIEKNDYSQENSFMKKYKNKKYYHYSPYNSKNPKMLKNISKDLLNFNSELYYNNNMPDILHYQYLLAPLYKNNKVINKGISTPYINVEDINNLNIYNNQDGIDMTNGELISNISRFNNYSSRIDESNSNIDNNFIDNSFNKKHLYFFNEPKYEMELTSGDNDIDGTKQNIKNNNYNNNYSEN